MNKIIKILIAFLGAVNVVYSLFIPIAVALMAISFFGFKDFWSCWLIIAAIASTFYRAIKIGFIREN